MNVLLRRTAYALCWLLLITACRKKAWDEYYNRPPNLEPPIYQQLQAAGHFTYLLACIDKARYKDILGSAGYWTLFAPNDPAFEKFFAEKGIKSIAELDSATARQIVTYALVYNAFRKDRLDDYQSNTGWVAENAFKRRTACYAGVYTETVNGTPMQVIASNRNNTNGGSYVSADNNNKYLPYFTNSYFSAKKLSAADYSFFYPNTPFTGFNVGGAAVVTADLAAENGVIHETDKVLLPLPSIDEYLAAQPAYSGFKQLFDKYMVQYVMNAEATHRHQVLTGSAAPVYVKTFSSLLAYSPNNENYLKLQDNDGQADGWSMFVPANDVLQQYIDTVLLEHYESLDKMPLQIIADFLNAHMWGTTVWPGKFSTTNNFLGEEARFDPQTNITERRMLSNGFFYGTNKVQEANVFTTVYGKAYLNPAYSLMVRALEQELKYIITNPKSRFTIFMMSDNVLRQAGFDFDIVRNEWNYTAPGGTRVAGNAARDRLLRILSTHVVITAKGELDDLSGEGIIDTYGGEYIRYRNNTVYAAGNQDAGQVVNVSGQKIANNGKVYYTNGLLNYSEQPIGKHIEQLAAPGASPFYNFYQYLFNSLLYNKTTGEITGLSPGVFYTFLIPDNAAIQDAVDNGWLPGTGTVPGKTPNFNPAATPEKEQVARFIQYHILNKVSVIANGKNDGAVETLLKDDNGDASTISIASLAGVLQLTDLQGGKANTSQASGNNLSNRAVIHLVDHFMKYNQ